MLRHEVSWLQRGCEFTYLWQHILILKDLGCRGCVCVGAVALVHLPAPSLHVHIQFHSSFIVLSYMFCNNIHSATDEFIDRHIYIYMYIICV